MAFSRALRGKSRLLALLTLTLLLLLFFVFLLAARKEQEDPPVYVVYTVLVETDERTADALRVGEALTDGRTKETAGELLALTREPSLREDAFGVYQHPTRVTLSLRIGAYGEHTAEGIRIGLLVPRVGETLYLYGRTRIEGTCVQVRAL